MASKDYPGLRLTMTVVNVAVYVLSTLAGIGLVSLAIVDAGNRRYDQAIVAGLALLGVLAAVAVWVVVAGVLRVAVENAEEISRLHRTTRASSDRQAQMVADMTERLDTLAHWTAMSEATRSVLARKRESEVFLKQIETTIGEGDWAEAERLINLFQDHFNDVAAANQLRTRIATARTEADERGIRSRISDVRSLIDQKNFPSAEMAMNRLANDYPKDNRLDDLRSTFLRARRRHSQELQERFRLLLADRQMEEALAILDEMRWLDPDTLQGLRDQWKETLRLAHHDARIAFSEAVKAKQWAEAAKQGDMILRLFPDTALATEVRKHIDALRQRAGTKAQPPAPAGKESSPFGG